MDRIRMMQEASNQVAGGWTKRHLPVMRWELKLLVPCQGCKALCRIVVRWCRRWNAPQPPATVRCLRHCRDQKVSLMVAKSIKALSVKSIHALIPNPGPWSMFQKPDSAEPQHPLEILPHIRKIPDGIPDNRCWCTGLRWPGPAPSETDRLCEIAGCRNQPGYVPGGPTARASEFSQNLHQDYDPFITLWPLSFFFSL